jgi:hypothetical protein
MGLPHQLYSLKRAIERQGQNAEIRRERLNDFNEPAGEPETVCVIRGLLHTTSLYLALSHLEAGQVRAKNQPQFLILHREDIREKDLLYLEEKPYTITGIDDPGNLHLCLDLSLEEGTHV